MDIIRFSKEAKKSILRLQKELRKVFSLWIKDIQRNGYISLKLNRSYRVIYKVSQYKSIQIINIERVSKHDYKE